MSRAALFKENIRQKSQPRVSVHGKPWAVEHSMNGDLGLSCDLDSNYTGNASLERVEESSQGDFPGGNCWSEVPGIQEFPKQAQAPT